MPANRSRTLRWRRCLQQIHERQGAIEIAIARLYREGDDEGRHLVWRVRLLAVSDDHLVVEQPVTLGQVVPIHEGTELIGIITVGQNRWAFSTKNLGPARDAAGSACEGLRLRMPSEVERCQRRGHSRVETGRLMLPEVDLWPLLDPKSVIVAERASELAFQAAEQGGAMRFPDRGPALEEQVMPEVGPKFRATLLNLGGGGAGLRVHPESGQQLLRHKLFWMRLSLEPEMSTPICATSKLVHTHMEATQYIYAGMAFDFTFNPGHQQFVVDQICRYLSLQQIEQRKRA